MMKATETNWLRTANSAIYQPGQQTGHYESYFLRANHPDRPMALWIRYTIFNPHGHPEKAIGELWAVYFNSETHSNIAVKKELPIGQCSFNRSGIDVRIGDALLNKDSLSGSATSHDHTISWDLSYGGNSRPLFLLPLKMYSDKFPKAKACVPLPMAGFNGTLTVDGSQIKIENWVGSQNHNWGSKHTDLYAWGQVAGFDNSPDSFLEVATARVKIGPVWTPRMTPIVLRHKGQEYALNGMAQTIRAEGRFSYFDWHFASADDDVDLKGHIQAGRELFAGLNYYNPPGGSKHCLNSKLATCELRITYKRGAGKGVSELLYTKHRAAFEILTDLRDHSIAIQV
jgi:hypothetical protein